MCMLQCSLPKNLRVVGGACMLFEFISRKVSLGLSHKLSRFKSSPVGSQEIIPLVKNPSWEAVGGT